MVPRKSKRHWNFKRSRSEERSFLDWYGSRKQPSVTEGMAHVEEFLESLVEEVGLREGVTIDELTTGWKGIVGEYVAQNSDPLDIREGTLRIRASQPMVKFELQQQQKKILSLVQKNLPQAKVKRIEVHV